MDWTSSKRRILRGISSVLALPLVLGCALHAEDADDDPVLLVKQLQHEDFDRRRLAAEKLAALGELAREALDAAAVSEDVELREAAATLLSKLDKATIRIMAFDREGKPAAGATADSRIYNIQGLNRQWIETGNEPVVLDAQGAVALKNQAPGQINLNMTWKKWSPVHTGTNYHSLLLQRGENPLVYTLSAGGTINTTIKDSEGKPVKDAQVVLYSRSMLEADLLEQQLAALDNWDRSAVNGYSDEKGKATVEFVAEGVYQVVVKSGAHYPVLGPVVRMREGETLEIPALTVVPRNPGKLQVVLQKEAGEPLKKTRVTLSMDMIVEGPNRVELQRTIKKLNAQINANRQADTSETDDDGKLAIEDLKPGKYNLTVVANKSIWKAGEVEIAPGKTADLKVLRPAPVGSVKGKVNSADGKGMQYANVYAVPEHEVLDANEGDLLTDWRFVYRQNSGLNSTQSQADGSYELGSLLPGKYIITLSLRTGYSAIVYGVEVVAGKETRAPDVTAPATAVTTARLIKGTVLLPDGRPADGASVSLFGPGRWSRNCDEKGGFDYNVSPEQGWNPTRLTIRVPKCKPSVVDLTVPGLKLDAITVRLEEQEYGDLRVKVVDESQQPLGEVLVKPVHALRNTGRTAIERKTMTNKRGEVRLNGLAAGERRFQVTREGYFCEDEIKVPVFAGREAQITVVMKRGSTVTGQLKAPPGATFENAVVSLVDSRTRVSRVDEKGRFEFSGVGPGSYFVVASAPGLVTLERTKLVIEAGDAADKTVTVSLDRPQGAAIKADPALQGWTASLSQPGVWDPERKVEARAIGYAGAATIDATGRAEFWAPAAGRFEVVFNPAQPLTSRYRWYEASMKKAVASLIAGPVDVVPLQHTADLKSLPAVELKAKPGTGTVTGRLYCDSAPNSNSSTGSVYLKVIGTSAMANVYFTYPADFSTRRNREPIIIGTPSGPEKKPALPGSFSISGLPPGEYRVYAELNAYRYSAALIATRDSALKQTPAPVARFTLKEGETLALGNIKFEPHPDAINAANNYDESQGDSEPDDMIPVFQP